MGHETIKWLSTLVQSVNSLARTENWQPLVDVYTTPRGWLIKFDMAGVLPEDVNLTLEGTRITVRGSRRDCAIESGCCHYRMEISYSHFERSIELPDNLERARLTSEFWHGMLLVRVEKEATR